MPSSSSRTDGGARPLPETVVVARILRARGLQGELVTEVLSDVPGRLAVGARCLLTGGPAQPTRWVEIVAQRPHPQGALLRLRGVETREAATALHGLQLEIERPVEVERPPGVYFEYELIGCRCSDRATGELGVLDDLVVNGGGQLLRIVGERGVLLVPFVESFVEAVDIAGRTIALRLPAGLLETCVSRS